MLRSFMATLALLATFGLSASGGIAADHFEMTLTLDSLSVVSFDDRVIIPIPSGSTIRMVGYPHQDGASAALRVGASDLSATFLALPNGGGTVRVEFLGPGKGYVRSETDGTLGIALEFAVRLSVRNATGTAVHEMPLRFTTESVEAWNADGTKRYEVSGVRTSPGTRQVQLVAATTAPAHESEKSGAAVYVVLSGRFDRVPPF